jgi:HK97 family phage prohead protease
MTGIAEAADKRVRGYSLLSTKAVEEGGRRILRGMATTPSVDRMGDIVDPMGVSFAKELPFLWQHRHDQPIGWVKFGKPTKDGIPFEAEVASTDEEGELKSFLDKCWLQLKLGLVRAVSIGFRALKWAWIGEYEGIEYQEVEVYELSAVTIPANADAVIAQVSGAKTADPVLSIIKSFDDGAPAANGRPAPPSQDPITEAAAHQGKDAGEVVEKSRGHVAKLARPASPGAPFVINRIHRPR